MEKILKQIASTLSNIENKETDLYWVENKLDKIIELLEKQCEISENIESLLNDINNNIPSVHAVDTDTIERSLDNIEDKLRDIDSNLDGINSNTSNL